MNLHRALPALVLALVAVLALAGCGDIQNSYGSATEPTNTPAAGTAASPTASAAETPASSTTVTIQNFAFVPASLTVKAGTEVTWINKDSTVHDVTSTDGPAVGAAITDLFASEVLNQGDSFSFTFSEPGTYYYQCTIHASMATMHAKVVVE